MSTRGLDKQRTISAGPSWTVHRYIACVDPGDGSRPGARRVLWLAVQALAWGFLPRDCATSTMVRALRENIRHGRDQQQLLPPARACHFRGLGAAGAAGVRVRRESEPFPDAH